jgi:hypothetical protein
MSPLPPILRNRFGHAARRDESGFTLMELLVAITAGLFVSIAAVALGRQGSKFFQQEARIATAQFGATLGFERMRADIARAGFMTTANIWNDPKSCPATPSANWPVGMKSLGAVRIEDGATLLAPNTQQTTNHLTPDRLTLTGSYSSLEWFPAAEIGTSAAGGFEVVLQADSGAVSRTPPPAGGLPIDGLPSIFRAGRVLRMLDTGGFYEYGAITGYTKTAGRPIISLAAVPAITLMRGSGTTCGVRGSGSGMLVNVIDTVVYAIRDMRTVTKYAPLFTPPPNTQPAPGDETRLELTRVELDTAGNEFADTLEIVAEYAVDLKFGLTIATNLPSFDPGLSQLAVGHADVYNIWANDVATTMGTAGPERIRSVRVRLAVRSREGDRPAGLTADSTRATYRYELPAVGSFARMRTLTADIALPNLAGLFR